MKKILLSLIIVVSQIHLSNGQVIISQYYEGSSNNKWIELTNIGSSSIDLTSPQLYLCLYSNASADAPLGLAPTSNTALTGSITPGATILYKNSSSVLPAYASGTTTGVCTFNGDDLVIISSSNSTSAWSDRIDVVGNGDTWGADKSFYRNSSVTTTNTSYTVSEWTEITNLTVDNASNGNSEYLGYHIYSGSSSSPTITTSTSSLSSFNYEVDNGPSTSQSFTVSGSNLTNNISVTTSENYEISADNETFQSTVITLSQSGGSVIETTIYVRLISGLAVSSYNENISIASTGASEKTVSCSGSVYAAISSNIVINEIDADTYGTDYDEFIELYDGGSGNTDLTGLVLVLYNGIGDVSYAAYDLDGETTDANGYFVLGSTQVPNVDKVIFTTNSLQNGPDAIALYQDDASNFPNGTAITLNNIIDAVVYHNAVGDDAGLLVLLNADEPQLNENANSSKDYHSLQRITNGSGGQRNTSSFALASPTPGTKNYDEIWNGNTDSDWTKAENWLNSLPNSTAKVFIPSTVTNFPNLTSSTTVADITIEHNAQLNGQENLTVNGTVTVKHQISKSTSASSLDRWQYFTSPFSGSTSGNLLSSNARIDLYMLQYNNTLSSEANNGWEYVTSTSAPFSAGKGYALTFVDDATETGTVPGTDYNLSFSGTLLDASSNATVTLTQGLNNWNFIGNPYLAPLNWFDDTHLDFSNIQGASAYVYNPATGSYITIASTGSGNGIVSPSGSELIPPLQGFFVSASSAGNFELDKDARVNTAQTFYKSETITPLLRIQVKTDSLMDETVLIYNEMAEQGFDAYDAHKLFSNGQSPQLTSIVDEHQLVFNQFNKLDEKIDLQVITKKAGSYQLEIGEITGIFNDYRVYLEQAGKEPAEITHKGYTIDAAEGINTQLFTLSFQVKTGLDVKQINPIKAFMNGQTLYVQSAQIINGSLLISNLAGQRILYEQINGHTGEFDLSGHSGMILVQLFTNKQVSTYKFYVR